VKAEYNFINEIIIVTAGVFITMNASVFIENTCNLWDYPAVIIVFNVRAWLMIICTGIVPLFRSNQLHFPLAQRLVIDLFQIFLDDETCIEAFDRFITMGRPKMSQTSQDSGYDHRKELDLFYR
jgi:hypothetical protein